MWKLLVVVALVLLIMLSAVAGSSLLVKNNDWDRIASAYSFNIIQWEFENLFSKWTYRAGKVFHPSELSGAETIQLVKDYLSLAQEISFIETRINREKAEGTASARDIAIWEEQLAALRADSEEREAQVEEIIEGQISAVLADEGLATTLKLGGEAEFLFPPLDFEFDDIPNLLIISPRHTIEIVDTTLLRSNMTLEEIMEVEGGVEELGFSALVEPIGGVATYPSIVPPMHSLQGLLSKIAHEWMHHYLFFRPLGQGYWSNYDMTTINETVAGIAGDEIGLLVYQRYYGGDKEEVALPEGDVEPAFDFSKEMRKIRLAVDQYLAREEIEEAKRYMEESRQYLAVNGYYIRKLNQAYFAFYGTYADTPSSVNPIGGQLQELREQSPSLVDFIRTISGISSYEELLELVGDESTT
ncbi:MAG: hypothetical protein MUP21_09910 [Dehalococcoidia bacterium]|nr:hypothetical protein [Dehalococcoidia bacterium]